MDKKPEVKVTLVQDHPILAKLTEHYVETWKKTHSRDKKPRTIFYPSDAGACPRKVEYDFACPEKKRDLSARAILTFKMGDLFHDELQQSLKAIGMTTAMDIEYGTFGGFPFETRGRLDVFIREENDEIAVADIKSKNSFLMDEEPSDKEIEQVLSYIFQCQNDKHLTESRGYKIARHGYLIYVDRGGMADVPFKVWRVDYSEERIEWLKAWYDGIWKRVQAGELHARPYVMESTECQYCRYKDHCWEGVPLAEPPAFEADEAIEAPEMELVESMAAAFVRLDAEAKRIEAERDRAHDTLMRYFKATGTETLPVNGAEIVHGFVRRTEFDRDYLASMLADKWTLIAAPQDKLIKAAIADGLIDPEIYERAKQTRFVDTIKIKKTKGGNHADQKSE